MPGKAGGAGRADAVLGPGDNQGKGGACTQADGVPGTARLRRVKWGYKGEGAACAPADAVGTLAWASNRCGQQGRTSWSSLVRAQPACASAWGAQASVPHRGGGFKV